MSIAQLIILSGIIGAFVTFIGVLFAVEWTESRKTRLPATATPHTDVTHRRAA